MSVDFKNLSLEELLDFEKNAKKLIKQKQNERLQEAYDKFLQIAKEYDSTISEIIKLGKPLKKPRPIKYQDPANSNNGWSGQGRTPRWLKQYLDAGKKLEDFLI